MSARRLVLAQNPLKFMSTEQPIVHKEPVVQSNPFAKHLPEHLNAGAVTIESERAIAEAQGKLVIAKRFPRDQARAYAAIIDACKRPGLAEEACYSFPRGGQTVSGPSIRLAEMLAANWGNIDYGIRELSRKEGVSEMEAYCWDLQTNTMSSQKFTVRHIRDTRGGGVKLTDERDIYELTANMGGRRLRARILAIIPADLVQAAVDECGKTMAGGNEVPLADRIRNMVTAFKTLGVQPALIEKRLGHTLDTATGEELGDLRKIHNSIRDGVSKVNDWFGDRPRETDEQMEGDPVTRPEPPPRAKKGAAAVKETVRAAAPEVVVEAAPVAPETPKPTEPALATTMPPEGKVFTQSSTVATKDVAPAPAPAKAATEEPRAFINDGEVLERSAKVKSLTPFAAKLNGQAGVTPSVKVALAGGYVGEVFHIGGAREVTAAVVVDGKETSPAVYEPNAPWAVGAEVRVRLLGKKSAAGPVRAAVESVEANPPEEF